MDGCALNVNWKRITEVLPEPGQECLVFNRGAMFVSSADFYDVAMLEALHKDANPDIFNSLKMVKGRFHDFGSNAYFNDPEVFWAELPAPPKECTNA
jgi:hypothetical protein